jgi:rhodanese-related sulfurtransferase
MMNKVVYPVFLLVLLFAATESMAEVPVITAEDVRSRMAGSRKVLLVDTRRPDEYVAGHIPGAVNIPPERMKAEAARLPRDRSVPIMFYCRGAG